jgi:YfiH family protein
VTFSDNAVVLRPWHGAREHGLSVAVTTRHGGVSTGPYTSLNLGLHVGDDPVRVVINRERAARAFGVDLNDTVFAEQVHGAHPSLIGRDDRGLGARDQHDAVAATDILVTTSTEVVPVMLVADCLPLALADPEAKVLAVVHAGWRGTAAGVVARAVATMAECGAQPERVVAFFGPAVAPDRYQVGPEVLEGLASAVAPTDLMPHVARPDGVGHWLVDLAAANRQQLLAAGVLANRLFDCGVTTADDDFFSDRAARPCGRFALLARLLP